jgi:hypothetical protein
LLKTSLNGLNGQSEITRGQNDDLISIEIHKGPWKACNTIKPKAPDGHDAREKDFPDIIYILVRTVVESNKKMEDHFCLRKQVQNCSKSVETIILISLNFPESVVKQDAQSPKKRSRRKRQNREWETYYRYHFQVGPIKIFAQEPQLLYKEAISRSRTKELPKPTE